LQVYETPDVDFPVAPAGEQNAPGATIKEPLLSTGVGVGAITGAGIGVADTEGVEEGVTIGVGVIVGVALTVGVALSV